jgi:two-component system, cell cycle sensor histidine kinase and response regulator CckA
MPVPLRVLILEDRLSDLELVLHELRRTGFDPQYAHVSNERDYRAHLSDQLELVLADYTLPQFDGLRALRILRQTGLSIPFIIVTGSISEEAAVQCMKEGAADYLIKDRLARLGPAVQQAIEGRKLQDEKKAAEEEIRRRNRELTVLNRIIAASTEGTDEHVFLQVACKELTHALGAMQAYAALLNDEKTESTVVAEYCPEGTVSVLGTRFSGLGKYSPEPSPPLTGPFVIGDLDATPAGHPFRKVIEGTGIGSLLIIPLEIGGRQIGGMAVAAAEPRHFTEDLVALARSVASQLAGALSRSRLERERQLLSSAIAQTKDGVIVTDVEGTILYVNPGFEAASGYARAEVIGRSAQMLDSGNAPMDFSPALERSFASGGEWRGRMVNRKKNGSLYTIDASISPVRDAKGAVISIVSVQRDISESLDMENRYLQAQKMEAVGRLAGGVAHDFNNLLTAILGYTDLLAADIPAGAPAADNLEEIGRAAERATALTRQLLTFSRKQVVQPKVFDLNDVVANIEKMLRHLIGEDVTLSTAKDPDRCIMRADPGQIEQVLMNLAVNARDAMPEGGTLRISTENVTLGGDADAADPPPLDATPPPGEYVLLSVADTGVGMSAEVQSHIFEPFFTTKGEGKGTGLGLATVYGIVRQSGGFLWPSSVVGAGTTFRIYFPRMQAEEPCATGQGTGGSPSRGTETILLVEDNDTVRSLANRLLAALGYSVIACVNAEEALQYVQTDDRRIDLLVSDIIMPGMRGGELARKIRSLRPAIRILFMSGYTDDTTLSEGPLDADTSFLQKPFTSASLAKAVRSALEPP